MLSRCVVAELWAALALVLVRFRAEWLSPLDAKAPVSVSYESLLQEVLIA